MALAAFLRIPSQLSQIIENQGIIMATNAAIKKEVEDLRAAVGLIGQGIGLLHDDLARAADHIAELQSGQVSPEILSALQAEVGHAKQLAELFQQAVDPDEDTPGEDELPDPVDDEGGEDEDGDTPGDGDGGEGGDDGSGDVEDDGQEPGDPGVPGEPEGDDEVPPSGQQ